MIWVTWFHFSSQWIIHTYCTFKNWAKYSLVVNVSRIKNYFWIPISYLFSNDRNEKKREKQKEKRWDGNEIHIIELHYKWNVMFNYVLRRFSWCFSHVKLLFCIIFAGREELSLKICSEMNKRNLESAFKLN